MGQRESREPVIHVLLFFLLILTPDVLRGQELSWDEAASTGNEALMRGDYAEAEKLLQIAVRKAQLFGLADERLHISLNNLAGVYMEQARYADAEALWNVWLARFEK